MSNKRVNKNTLTEQRFADSILTGNLGLVRVSDLDPKQKIQVLGKWITVADIRIDAVSLSCGHHLRGIALSPNDLVFCERCHENKTVI